MEDGNFFAEDLMIEMAQEAGVMPAELFKALVAYVATSRDPKETIQNLVRNLGKARSVGQWDYEDSRFFEE